MTESDLRQNIAALEQSLRPAPHAPVAKAVAQLAARTKSRVQGDAEARLVALTMAKDLSQYPLDVVEFACTYWVEGGADAKWLPSWPELREICERRVRGRQKLKRALESILSGAVSP